MSLGVFNSAAFLTASQLAVAAGATVEVRRESDSALASIFSDRAGTAAITNPSAFADASGRFTFYVAASAGGFSIEVTSGAESFTLRNVPIGLGQEFDIVESWRASLAAAISATIASLLAAADAAAAFLILKQDATTAATGVVELAVQSEMDAGTAGKVPTTDLNKIALGTLTATTSGASSTFSSIPAGVRRIHGALVGVSTNGTNGVLLRLGEAGAGLKTTGYNSVVINATNAASPSVVGVTTGFSVSPGGSASVVSHGMFTAVLVDSATNLWAIEGASGNTGTTSMNSYAGTVALAGVLDRIALVTADTFDLGSWNISYER